MVLTHDLTWASRLVPIYAFSVRESVEETLPDGTVHKTACFRHKGFVVRKRSSNYTLPLIP